MVDLNSLVKTADWKSEKHAPSIEIIGEAKKEGTVIKVSVGKEIAHPNTTEHFIAWINVYFLPEGENIIHVGQFTFNAHGASTKGANASTVYTAPEATINLKTEKLGTIIAFSFCNIHGLWKNELDLKI
ncbi:MAG: superoxide reductase [Candidatus Helarchaeota archaeon]|nr:superoxide reductase [Candidatus Helarchaeota archaeon]